MIDPEEKRDWEVVVLAGMDEVIAGLARLAHSPEFEGKPAATLAAGWASGLLLTEKERLRKSVEDGKDSA